MKEPSKYNTLDLERNSKMEENRNSWIKKCSMVTLVLQNSSLALFMRFSRSNPIDGAIYSSSTAVVCAEAIKVISSLGLQLKEEGSVSGLIHSLQRDIFNRPYDMLKMFIPASLYCLQNNLAYVAITNLDGPTYQLLYQLKILTTAMFSVLMLNKALSSRQWLSLFLLGTGVYLVQQSSTTSVGDDQMKENSLVGLVAVLSACATSGFAGVYFEKVLKTSKVSVWMRNIQLAGFGFVIGYGGVILGPDASAVKENGFFSGYNWTVWAAVMLNSLGGLVVAVVVKYADNVVKGFATSISILMTCVVSYFFFGFEITAQFVVVLYSTYLYGKQPAAKPKEIHVSGQT